MHRSRFFRFFGECELAVELKFLLYYGFVVRYVHTSAGGLSVAAASPAVSATVDMMR